MGINRGGAGMMKVTLTNVNPTGNILEGLWVTKDFRFAVWAISKGSYVVEDHYGNGYKTIKSGLTSLSAAKRFIAEYMSKFSQNRIKNTKRRKSND